MAKHLEKFTSAFARSSIPFVLAEVLTNGQGELVDLVCRFINAPAAALLNAPAETLRGRRFTRVFPSQPLEPLRPLHTVAFSGSSCSFSYTTVLGRTLSVTCYQPMYGLAACVLDPGGPAGRDPGGVPLEAVCAAAAVVRLGRDGLRCLAFNQRLCALSGWSRRELLDQFGGELSALVDPADYLALLQILLDAAREGQPVDHDLRLLRKSGGPVWVNLRAEAPVSREGSSVFYALLLDVDQQRRAQARLQDALHQLQSAQQQTAQLLDGLPGGYALLRQDAPGGPPVPLRLSRGLGELLGVSEGELFRRLREDPLWQVAADEREELTAAAVRARASGLPLRRTCRIRPKGGGNLLVALEAVWRPQSDGGSLVYVACSDVTQEREAAAELEFRAQLCDLLLDRSGFLIFDYDPAADVLRIERHGPGGRRTVRTLSPYLASLGEAGFLHPEDRRRMAAALRRASARPGAVALEYRADYDGQGWRWYRMRWVSLFDGGGNVCRILGKAEDVTRTKAALQHFAALAARQADLAGAALSAARLDLTANRLLGARAGSRHLQQLLFSNTADECVAHVEGALPDLAERARFAALFGRESLLEAFGRGIAHVQLDHCFTAQPGAPLPARTLAEISENPETGHIEAFCRTDPVAPPSAPADSKSPI